MLEVHLRDQLNLIKFKVWRLRQRTGITTSTKTVIVAPRTGPAGGSTAAPPATSTDTSTRAASWKRTAMGKAVRDKSRIFSEPGLLRANMQIHTKRISDNLGVFSMLIL